MIESTETTANRRQYKACLWSGFDLMSCAIMSCVFLATGISDFFEYLEKRSLNKVIIIKLSS